MKALLLLPLLSLLAFVGSDAFQFQQNSVLSVNGTSNVRGWSCETSQMAGTVEAATENQRLSSVNGVTLTVPIQGLECGNGQMNGKVRESLGANGSNFVRFNLSDASVGAPDAQGRSAVTATGRLTIAGKTRTIRVPATAEALDGGRIRLTGNVPLTMTDFGVSPPTAMLGALRTADDVTVSFNVIVGR